MHASVLETILNIGLIAGGGKLPKHIITAAKESGYELSVIGIKNFANKSEYPEAQFYHASEFGKILKIFKKNNVTDVCFAGVIKRPDFSSFKPDLKGIIHLKGLINASKRGDDSLMRYIMSLFEKEGFKIISPQVLCKDLLLSEGSLNSTPISDAHKLDIDKGISIAQIIGSYDIGQSVVVCNGLVLALEAQEGTDLMLERVSKLPKEIRGDIQNPRGVLVKVVKPSQDTRIDLPTIGPETIRRASEAGLSGVAGISGKTLILERINVIKLADQLGLFVVGINSREK